MKKLKIFFKSLTLLSSLSILTCDDCSSSTNKQTKNFLPFRAFSMNSANEIISLKTLYDNHFKRDEWDKYFSISTEYSQSFGDSCGSSLGAMPFWSGNNKMTIGTNDGNSDVDAYQFGMGNVKTPGEISLTVLTKQLGMNFMGHITQNKHNKGFFLIGKLPFGAMITEPKITEIKAELNREDDADWLSYPAPANRPSSMDEAFASGGLNNNMNDTLATASSSLHKPISLEKGRIISMKSNSLQIGDPSLTIGYNVIGDDFKFLGIGAKITLPAGKTPTGELVFEPIFGRSGQIGTGIELISHYKYWIKKETTEGVDFWLQSELLHLFSCKSPSYRSFDLKLNGPGSKYLLLQYYFASNEAARTPTFITQAVNVTTLPVHSSFLIEGNFSCAIEYCKRNWNIGLGVDAWLRSEESIKIDKYNFIKDNCANLNDFAVLGRQISEKKPVNQQGSNLFLCEPLARINKSQNRSLNTNNHDVSIKDATKSENRIPENLYEALDFNGATEKAAYSLKLFTNIGYVWRNEKYMPGVNISASTEFAKYGDVNINFLAIGIQGSFNF